MGPPAAGKAEREFVQDGIEQARAPGGRGCDAGALAPRGMR